MGFMLEKGQFLAQQPYNLKAPSNEIQCNKVYCSAKIFPDDELLPVPEYPLLPLAG